MQSVYWLKSNMHTGNCNMLVKITYLSHPDSPYVKDIFTAESMLKTLKTTTQLQCEAQWPCGRLALNPA
jgi:hypothetical protein